MQLYCYVKQIDEVRKFFRRLDVSKHVMPLRSAFELEALCLHGQVFVHFPDHVEPAPNELTAMASVEGMFTMEIHVGEGCS